MVRKTRTDKGWPDLRGFDVKVQHWKPNAKEGHVMQQREHGHVLLALLLTWCPAGVPAMLQELERAAHKLRGTEDNSKNKG